MPHRGRSASAAEDRPYADLRFFKARAVQATPYAEVVANRKNNIRMIFKMKRAAARAQA